MTTSQAGNSKAIEIRTDIMKKSPVIFSHGKESGPWGSKIRRLADEAKILGHDVFSIDYRHTMDPDERVKVLSDHILSLALEPILVGSSMGGYVSLVNSSNHNIKKAFLLAPALYMPDYRVQTYSTKCPVTIVHGWQDDVIPIENSICFAQKERCTLHLVDGDHRLNTSLDLIIPLFKAFLNHDE